MRRDWWEVSWHDVLTLIEDGDKNATKHARRRVNTYRSASTQNTMTAQVDEAIAKAKVKGAK